MGRVEGEWPLNLKTWTTSGEFLVFLLASYIPDVSWRSQSWQAKNNWWMQTKIKSQQKSDLSSQRPRKGCLLKTETSRQEAPYFSQIPHNKICVPTPTQFSKDQVKTIDVHPPREWQEPPPHRTSSVKSHGKTGLPSTMGNNKPPFHLPENVLP